jgi:hypothetical protein
MATAAAKKRRPTQGRETFRYVEGFQVSRISAQELGMFIRRLQRQLGRQAKAPELVEAARPRDSPIHHLFDWDDRSAAKKYRMEQARYLLRSVVVEVQVAEDRPPLLIRANLPMDTGDGHHLKGYVPLDRAMTEEEMREMAVHRAWQELLGWRRRHRDLRELAGICAAIDRENARR